MNGVVFVCIILIFAAAGFLGIGYLNGLFMAKVEGREYTIKGRKCETNDPYVRKQYRIHYAQRVFFALSLLALLFVVLSYV